MPTYEYECLKCKKSFDLIQSMKDDALTTCPKNACRMKSWGRGKVKRKMGGGAGFIFKGKVKRQLGTGAGLIFKGSGFYITDYRSEGYKSAAKKESSDSTPAKKTETKTEAKPAKAKE
jgi:putative FmdB family regulatory protein